MLETVTATSATPIARPAPALIAVRNETSTVAGGGEGRRPDLAPCRTAIRTAGRTALRLGNGPTVWTPRRRVDRHGR